MKKNLAKVAAGCLAASFWLTSHVSQAQESGRFYGMLRSRDLTPFGFLRLDMRPAHAVSIEKHTFAFEAEPLESKDSSRHLSDGKTSHSVHEMKKAAKWVGVSPLLNVTHQAAASCLESARRRQKSQR